MIPEEKVAVISFMLWEERNGAISIKWSNPEAGTITAKELVDKLMDEWQEDIFLCPSCNGCFVLGDGVEAGNDVIDGKAGSPSEIVCKGCANAI